MEPSQQIMAWKKQLDDNPDAVSADIDVARRLVRHAIEADAALSQQRAVPEGDWRVQAAEWLEAKASEQAENNERWPEHAACYPSWRESVGLFRDLAREVLAAPSPEQEESP